MTAQKSTLIKYLTGSLSYDSSWGVYAEKIDGAFKPESPARFGQSTFENGGMLDECELFAINERIVDARECYTDGDDDFAQEWAEQYIEEMNEADQ